MKYYPIKTTISKINIFSSIALVTFIFVSNVLWGQSADPVANNATYLCADEPGERQC